MDNGRPIYASGGQGVNKEGLNDRRVDIHGVSTKTIRCSKVLSWNSNIVNLEEI
jgi:hypothetical protein